MVASTMSTEFNASVYRCEIHHFSLNRIYFVDPIVESRTKRTRKFMLKRNDYDYSDERSGYLQNGARAASMRFLNNVGAK